MSSALTSKLFNHVAYRYGHQDRRQRPWIAWSPFLNKLPQEIRNLIYQFCIEEATQSKWWNERHLKPWERFGLSIIPRLYDPPIMSIDGYGSIPLRGTCKQIYDELAFQVSFNVDRVRIGSYNFEHKEKDPLVHWRTAYSLLETHPGLRLSVTHVIIKMPTMRDEMMRNQQLSLGHVNSETLRKFDKNSVTIIPGLIQCLTTFDSLERITIIITVEKRQPPNFEPLLRIYNLFGRDTSIVMRPPRTGLRTYDPWVREWEYAWSICLRNKEVEDMNLQEVLLAGARIITVPKRPR